MRKRVFLIGPLNKGQIPCTGDTMKNQLFEKRFSEIFDEVMVIDTYNWKSNPLTLIAMLFKLLWYSNVKIVLSVNSDSAERFIRLLNKLNVSKRVFYWVVGGSLHTTLLEGKRNWRTYSNLAGILVQGQSMVETMNKIGLYNVSFVPNSKYIDYIPLKEEKVDDKTHFVFLSRVERTKGCDLIFSSIDILNERGYKGKYDITFYGKTTTELGYFEDFKKNLKRHENVYYKGVLNLRDTKNYDELSRYDVMLFPTFWPGEGFPGVIIDAYIAGLPVISFDWNLNKDVVIENETGWIVPTHDVNSLAEKMIYAIEHPDEIYEMSQKCFEKATFYDSRNVLSEENLAKLGLL